MQVTINKQLRYVENIIAGTNGNGKFKANPVDLIPDMKEEQSNNEFLEYPNPARDKINLSIHENSTV